jgi:opacity protein-like surface antigen
MKPRALLVAILVAGAAAPAAAQQPRTPLVRADISATAGWFNANRLVTESEDDWYHHSLYGGVEAGWYWTDHVKTQIEVGAHTKDSLHHGRQVVVDGVTTFELSEFSLSERKLALIGHYQFGRNAWFHPHVGAGVDLSWESTTLRVDPVYSYGDPTRATRLLRDARTERREALVVRPCAEIGFKAYVSPQAFFKTDFRLRTGSRTDEALLRFGFGMDF